MMKRRIQEDSLFPSPDSVPYGYGAAKAEKIFLKTFAWLFS